MEVACNRWSRGRNRLRRLGSLGRSILRRRVRQRKSLEEPKKLGCDFQPRVEPFSIVAGTIKSANFSRSTASRDAVYSPGTGNLVSQGAAAGFRISGMLAGKRNEAVTIDPGDSLFTGGGGQKPRGKRSRREVVGRLAPRHRRRQQIIIGRADGDVSGNGAAASVRASISR